MSAGLRGVKVAGARVQVPLSVACLLPQPLPGDCWCWQSTHRAVFGELAPDLPAILNASLTLVCLMFPSRTTCSHLLQEAFPDPQPRSGVASGSPQPPSLRVVIICVHVCPPISS